MAKVKSTFETLDESIDHSARHDPWFRASKTIVGVGSLLEIAAMTVYRREFRPNDPIVGPLLGTFTVLYLAAWMHVFLYDGEDLIVEGDENLVRYLWDRNGDFPHDFVGYDSIGRYNGGVILVPANGNWSAANRFAAC